MCDREAIRKLAEAATAGPWAYEHVGEKSNECIVGGAMDTNGNHLTGRIETNDDFVCERVCETDGGQDAAYIAAANPKAMLDLLDMLDAADEKIAQLESDNDGLLAASNSLYADNMSLLESK